MKDKTKVADLLAALKAEMTTEQEINYVNEFERKLNGEFPKVEVIDEKHQKFLGFKFYANKEGRYVCNILLHRLVWTLHNGIIPPNCSIHHEDFEPSNNNIANLQLLTKSAHSSLHMRQNTKILNKIRDIKAKIDDKCAYCGANIKILNTHPNNDYHFCPNGKCYTKWLQKNKYYSEVRICAYCGKEYLAEKYRKSKRCKSCASKLAHQRKQAKNLINNETKIPN